MELCIQSFDIIVPLAASLPSYLTSDISNLKKWLGIPHHISLIGRHESNGTEHVNASFVGHLRRLVNDERLVHRWASDTVLPLINHATMPNSELGGLSPSELKFGTRDFKFFQLPRPLIPGDKYGDLVKELDHNLATVHSTTATFQQSLRDSRRAITSPTKTNIVQPGDLVLWNSREHSHSFRSSKLAPKLLGPTIVYDKECSHSHLNSLHQLQSSSISPWTTGPFSIKASKYCAPQNSGWPANKFYPTALYPSLHLPMPHQNSISIALMPQYLINSATHGVKRQQKRSHYQVSSWPRYLL